MTNKLESINQKIEHVEAKIAQLYDELQTLKDERFKAEEEAGLHDGQFFAVMSNKNQPIFVGRTPDSCSMFMRKNHPELQSNETQYFEPDTPNKFTQDIMYRIELVTPNQSWYERVKDYFYQYSNSTE